VDCVNGRKKKVAFCCWWPWVIEKTYNPIAALLQQSYAGLTDCHGYKKTDLPLQHTFEAKLQTSLILLQW
jgi:hypothetical protein